MGRHTFVFFYLVEPHFTTILYGLSVLSGPALAIAAASVWCLVPYHNVLEEPCYWYEFHIALILGFMPLFVWIHHPLGTEYWANFSMKGSFNTYILLYFYAIIRKHL